MPYLGCLHRGSNFEVFTVISRHQATKIERESDVQLTNFLRNHIVTIARQVLALLIFPTELTSPPSISLF